MVWCDLALKYGSNDVASSGPIPIIRNQGACKRIFWGRCSFAVKTTICVAKFQTTSDRGIRLPHTVHCACR